MYRLTLTRDERGAISWVGYHYSHGHDLYKLLLRADWECPDWDSEDFEWMGGYDITFVMSEGLAWELQDLLEDSHFECFSGELVSKFLNFMGAIV